MAPRVRANWMKLVIGTAKRRPAHERDAILNSYPSEFRDQIRAAASLAWLPAEVMSAFHVALANVGREAAEDFWRRQMYAAMQTPSLKPLRGGALRMFGASPAGLLKFAPHAWSLVTRDCGSIRFGDETSPRDPRYGGACKLIFSDFSDRMPLDLCAPMLVGTPNSVLDLLDHDGESSIIAQSGHRLEILTQWEAQPRRRKDLAA